MVYGVEHQDVIITCDDCHYMFSITKDGDNSSAEVNDFLIDMWNEFMSKEPHWDSVPWRRLNKGEIIKEGDWVDAAPNGWKDWPKWELAKHRIGEPAPDPIFAAHSKFRRLAD